MWPNPEFFESLFNKVPCLEGLQLYEKETPTIADLVTFTEETLDGKLHFLYSVSTDT